MIRHWGKLDEYHKHKSHDTTLAQENNTLNWIYLLYRTFIVLPDRIMFFIFIFVDWNEKSGHTSDETTP